MTAPLARLQQAIEVMYRLDGAASVTDFHVGEEVLESVLGEGARDEHRETLLVRETGDEVEVALYVAEEVVRRAHRFLDGEADRLDHLDEFCVATEGVSHFVYVMFCGAAERPVSPIELEVQAEIDKYLVIRLLCELSGPELVGQLYDRFQLAPRLLTAERERYTVANRAGRRYARWIDRELGHGRGARALDDARALYRKPLAAKLEHIARAA